MAAFPNKVHHDQAGTVAANEWVEIATEAPEVAATMGRYLRQLATFLSPGSVVVADNVLRQLAQWALADTDIKTVAEFRRDDIEDFKVWLAARPGVKGKLSAETQRQRLRTLRAFFERIIEWDWPYAASARVGRINGRAGR